MADAIVNKASKNTTPTPASSLLASLKFSNDVRPRRADALARTAKDVVLQFIAQQVALAEAEARGVAYTVSRERYVKDETGRRVKKQVEATPRKSYWVGPDGNYRVSLGYGSVPITINGHASVVCGKQIKDVTTTLAVIADAVAKGELDESIASAASKASRKKAA